MGYLLRWLSQEVKGKRVLFLIIIVVILNIAYAFCVGSILQFLGVGLGDNSIFINNLLASPWYYNILFIIGAAFLEEIIFRFIPILFCVKIFGISRWSLLVVFLVSCEFGYFHYGFVSIFLQGVSGILYSIVYIKCGGFQRRHFKALLSSTVAHALYNGTLMVMMFVVISYFV